VKNGRSGSAAGGAGTAGTPETTGAILPCHGPDAVTQPTVVPPGTPQTPQLAYELQSHQLEFGIHNDELLAMQGRLRDLSEKYVDLFDFAPCGYFCFDRSGRIIDANLTGATQLGIERGSLKGKQFYDFIAPQDRDRLFLHLRNAFAEGSSPPVVLRIMREGAGWFYGEARTVLSGAAGEWGCRTSLVDVTERKQVELLQEQAELLDLTHDAVIFRDMDDRIVFWNKGAESNYGWSAAEVSGTVAHYLLRTAFPKPLKDIRKELLAKGRWDGELVHTGRDGTKITVLSRWSLRVGKTGEPEGTLEINTDITESKGMQEALRRANDELERRVAERTEELASAVAALKSEIRERKVSEKERHRLEQQLVQSQKMESIGILAGGVAHDFNNLLTAINGYASLIQEGLEDYEDDLLSDAVSQVLKAGSRAADLTANLLAFSRKQLNDPIPLDINGFIEEVVGFYTRIIGEDIDVTTFFCSDDIVVMADRGQMNQVLLNLAANARDAMPQGGRLRIRTQRVSLSDEAAERLDMPEGEYARIDVTDSGAGMEKRIIEKIFDPFFTTKEVGKGTGLGLSIIYGIVKQHGGAIIASSRIGRGSRFSILLPIHAGETTPPHRLDAPAAKGGRETILLVEDDEIVRKYLAMILSNAGYMVITAANGAEAAAEFLRAATEVALLITDLILPGKDGRRLYKELREMHHGLRAIFISGYPGNGTTEPECDGARFIGKPIKRNILLQNVREILDR
jgi:PAS domain S-box-containing protein